MNRIFLLILSIIITHTVQGQVNIQVGDSCFDRGNYTCAFNLFDNVFRNSKGKDRLNAEIKLIRTKECIEHVKAANEAFFNQNFTKAKEEYLQVLDSNPKDSYVQSQILKCNSIINTPKLRKATTSEITDIWNNKYGQQPTRRQNLINAGIDADDALRRISAGEGKPQVIEKQESNLNVSKTTIYFNSNGGTSEEIKVSTTENVFTVPSFAMPKWCIANVFNYNGYFTITASPNLSNTSRRDWFIVSAGKKDVRIYVEQAASSDGNKDVRIHVEQDASSETIKPNTEFENKFGETKKNEFYKNYSTKRFNRPKTHDSWGLTMAYAPKSKFNSNCDFMQLGLKFEPLFNYGFGLNTGIIFESSYKNTFDFYTLILPLHLEYRLNFSKWFNMYSYGGFNLNYIGNNNSSDYKLTATSEYGVGVRINHLQFNVGENRFMSNLNGYKNFVTYPKYPKGEKNIIVAISYMF